MAMYYFHKFDTYRGREYLLRAAHIVHRHGLRMLSFARSVQKDADRTEMLRANETIGTLGQLFFVDIAQNRNLLLGKHPLIVSENVLLELGAISVRLLLVSSL